MLLQKLHFADSTKMENASIAENADRASSDLQEIQALWTQNTQ